MGTFVGFAQQQGGRDDALGLAVDDDALAVTNLEPVRTSSSPTVAPTDPTLAAAKACF